jgi:hypothetical protein
MTPEHGNLYHRALRVVEYARTLARYSVETNYQYQQFYACIHKLLQTRSDSTTPPRMGSIRYDTP